MSDESVGSIPVVMDQESRRLVGVITDRDLCCSVVADGLESSVVLTGRVESDLQHDLALRLVRSYAADRKLVDKVRVPQ